MITADQFVLRVREVLGRLRATQDACVDSEVDVAKVAEQVETCVRELSVAFRDLEQPKQETAP